MNDSDARESYRILFLPANAADAESARQLLGDAGLTVCVCSDLSDLVAEIAEGAGAVLIAEERLQEPELDDLIVQLQRQPAWSDLPVLISARSGPTVMGEALEERANVTYLERPVRVRSLISNLRAALRGRKRQYETERAIRSRDQFLAMLSHELRNPLSAITLALRQVPAPRSRAVEILQRQAQNLGRIVDDLVEVSRMSRGKIDLQRELVDFSRVVKVCTDAHRVSLRAKGLHLSLALPDEPVWVSGDAVRLEQVVTNLLNNAIKYTPAGGRITVAVDRERRDVRLRVQDTGIGIPRDMLDQVFELFTQAHADVSRRSGGLGIGLNLVQTLVRLHGGSVVARSAGPLHGSEFIVRLPQAKPQPATAVPIRAVRPEGQTSLRVLIVDDLDDIREMLCLMLTGFGHQVQSASGGRSALKRFAAEPFDVVLIDIGLPDLDGYEVARRIREQDAQVRLIAVTGYGQPDDRERALRAGFDLHVTKPVDIDVLQNLLYGQATERRRRDDAPGWPAPPAAVPTASARRSRSFSSAGGRQH